MWTRIRDPACLRGLKYVYETEAALCSQCFADFVRAQFDGALVEAHEALGSLEYHRMILPFRFELWFGLAEREVEVHHRLSADPQARETTYEVVEQALSRTLGAACPHA